MADRLRVTELDFDTIKQNLKTFLNQQSEFTDYDFEGSGLNILLDVLAYNTHYQAYYLNMVANESFLDTALLRDSVISQSKVLGYVPYSRKAPRALINFTANTSSNASATLTIPKGYRFLSEQIDGVSYGFVTLEETKVTKANNDFTFFNLPIHEGQFVTYNFTHSEASNPKQVYTLPDTEIDTTTITVKVQPSNSNTDITVYTLATDSSNTITNSEVFYLQEGKSQQYDIYFGNNVIGKKLPDGAILTIQYLVTNGEIANKANNFVATQTLVDSLGNTQTDFIIDPVAAASGGAERESVDNIKFAAPLLYTTQNRLITFSDYEAYITKNYPSVDSVSVWGGEDETPPKFGIVYVALKPKNNYYISETEKQRIIDEIIKPKAIVAIQTVILEPEFLYLKIDSDVRYNPRKTTLTEEQLKTLIRNAIISYKSENLERFDSQLILSRVQDAIDKVDTNSIIGSSVSILLQKRFTPILNASTPYTIKFNVPLRRGTIGNKLTSTFFTVADSQGVNQSVQFDEIPQSFSGITSIQVTNPGAGYISLPTITITGDGVGANATAVILNGQIQSIEMVNRGIDYTRATVTITGGGGSGATGVAVIDGRIGTIRTVYYDSFSQRQIVDENAGEIDYDTGTITISNLNVKGVDATDGDIRLTIESEKDIISSSKNTIITIDQEDATSISTTLETV
jgi:hypothetical protein